MRTPKPRGDSWGPVMDRILGNERRIRDLEKASGTQIAGTVAYLKSLVTRGDSYGSVVLGPQPGDAVFHWFSAGNPIEVTLDAPTGRVLVTVSCGEANLSPGEVAAQAAMTFSITTLSGWEYPMASNTSRNYQREGRRAGVPLMLNIPVSVPTFEPITVQAFVGVWSTSTVTLAEATFNSPSLIVQVIDPITF